MTTKALPAKGYALKRGDGASPEVFTKIAEIMDLPGTNRTQTMIDATSLDSTWDEAIPGLKKGNEITLQCIFVPSDTLGQAGIETDFTNETLRNFKVVATNSPATTYSFAAYVSAINGPAGNVDSKLTQSITLKISGAVTVS